MAGAFQACLLWFKYVFTKYISIGDGVLSHSTFYTFYSYTIYFIYRISVASWIRTHFFKFSS